MLIAVCDGLKGLPEAITTTRERTVVQQGIVHLIRNSFRYAGRTSSTPRFVNSENTCSQKRG